MGKPKRTKKTRKLQKEIKYFKLTHYQKLENIDFQKKVYYNMLNEFELAKMNKSSFLQKDSCKMLLIEDVKKQIISIIEKE